MAGIQRRPSRRDQYKLVGVTVLNDRVLYYGPYTTDLELEYVGLKCIGKKLHQAMFMQGETTAKVRQLKEQCHLLSQIRHPNIAMFLGLFFQQSPILVLEFLPYNLVSCIEHYGALPDEISYSILRDVALGLSYLHNYTPTIVHGELTSSNILLTADMTAKISYLGETRILRLTQAEIANVAQKTGMFAYMPPEFTATTGQAFLPHNDIYSYGIMMIHTLSGKLPNTEASPSSSESDEHERFSEFISKNHPLATLILQCTNSSSPQQRPSVDEIVSQVGEMASKFPTSFTHRLDMLKRPPTKDQGQDAEEKEIALLQENIQQIKKKLLLQNKLLTILSSDNELLRKRITSDSEVAGSIIQELQKLQTQEEISRC